MPRFRPLPKRWLLSDEVHRLLPAPLSVSGLVCVDRCCCRQPLPERSAEIRALQAVLVPAYLHVSAAISAGDCHVPRR
ncbi:hypothetical protein D3C80_1920330 [compost metagenome]